MKNFVIIIIFILSAFKVFSEVKNPDLIPINFTQKLEDTIAPNYKLTLSSKVVFLDSFNAVRSLYGNPRNMGFIIQKTMDGGYNWSNIYADTVHEYIEDGKKKLYMPKMLIDFDYFSNHKIILYCSSESYRNACYNIISTDNGITWSEEKYDSLNEVYFYTYKEEPILKVEFGISDGNFPFQQNKYYVKLENGEWDRIIFPDSIMQKKYSAFKLIDSNTIFINFVNDTSGSFATFEYFPYLYYIDRREFEPYLIPEEFNKYPMRLQFRTVDDAMVTYYKFIPESNNKEWDTYIIRTTNKWKTWDTLLNMTEFTKWKRIVNFLGITYYDSLNILIYGVDYNIIKTNDGGKSWKQLSVPQMSRVEYDSLQFNNIENMTWMNLLVNFSGCSWTSKNVCYVYSGDYYWSLGIIYRFQEYPTSFIDNYNNMSILPFPNPARSTTRVKLQQEGQVAIMAVDLLGRTFPLWSGNASTGDMELDVSTLPTGSYTLLIDYGTKREAVRLMKE